MLQNQAGEYHSLLRGWQVLSNPISKKYVASIAWHFRLYIFLARVYWLGSQQAQKVLTK